MSVHRAHRLLSESTLILCTLRNGPGRRQTAGNFTGKYSRAERPSRAPPLLKLRSIHLNPALSKLQPLWIVGSLGFGFHFPVPRFFAFRSCCPGFESLGNGEFPFRFDLRCPITQ